MKRILVLVLVLLSGCGETEKKKVYHTPDYTVSVTIDENGYANVSVWIKTKASTPKQAIKNVTAMLKELPETEE